MDKEELQKNIALYYSKLPPKAQEVFGKMEWLATLGKISAEHNLSVEQKESLGTETTLALLGIISFAEYKGNLVKEIKLEQNLLDKILLEIEDQVFKDIRPELIEAFTQNTQAEPAQGEDSENEAINMSGALDPRIQKLPDNIKKIIEDSKYQSALYDVARAHKLSISQMGTLERLTTDLITGTTRPEDFQKSLARNFALPKEEVAKLAEEVNNKVFRKIREGLMIMSGRNPSEIVEQPVELPAEDKSLLKTHGIELVDEVAPEDEPKAHPIIAQKLSAPIQVPVIKTEHNPTPAPVVTTEGKPAPKPSSYPPKADPYREVPE